MGVKKLKLNENMGEIVKAHGYELDAEERYVINLRQLVKSGVVVQFTLDWLVGICYLFLKLHG